MKKIIVTLINWLASILHRNTKSKIIYYHDVGTDFTSMGTSLNQIINHLKIMDKSGYNIVSKIDRPNGEIMICFDDGWRGIYDAKDFFVERGISPTVFVAVDLIGKSGYLSLKQILELQSLGFLFESHTWTHRDLTTLSDEELRHELRDSRYELSSQLGKPVNAICFPKGRFSDYVVKLAIEAGYSAIYSSIPGGYDDMLNDYGILCRNLVQFTSDINFKHIINSTSNINKHRTLSKHYVRETV